MLVLALESSCDETAAAVVEGGVVLSEMVRSQADLHCRYGGVVPEIASRAHLEAADVLAEGVLRESGKALGDLGGIAVTQGPGLVGALLVALSFAKGLSLATGLPVTGVNHVKAHALSPFLRSLGEDGKPAPPLAAEFPITALVASGGHTSLFLLEGGLSCRTLGRTLDDAAGEAFDKCAKLMGLGYPGGAAIEGLASGGDPSAYSIKPPMLKDGLNFSFSGLKTRVRAIYREENMDSLPADARELKDLAAAFQAACVEVLAAKLLRAALQTGSKAAFLAGGVAANKALRARARGLLGGAGVPLHAPPAAWCADNASMIGCLGALQLERGVNILRADSEARARWPVDEDL